MTKKVIDQAVANSRQKEYQELYIKIAHMLNEGPAGLGEGTGQVYFNRAGMDVLFEIWRRGVRNGNRVSELRKEVAVQTKEIHDLKREKAVAVAKAEDVTKANSRLQAQVIELIGDVHEAKGDPR